MICTWDTGLEIGYDIMQETHSLSGRSGINLAAYQFNNNILLGSFHHRREFQKGPIKRVLVLSACLPKRAKCFF